MWWDYYIVGMPLSSSLDSEGEIKQNQDEIKVRVSQKHLLFILFDKAPFYLSVRHFIMGNGRGKFSLKITR